MNNKEYSFLEKTIFINFPDDWIVKEKDNRIIKVNFPFGPYPTLDCYVNCFDNPKLNEKDKIKQYILDGIDPEKEIDMISDTLFILKHEFRTAEENLLLFKIIGLLKPRTFREVRFSLAWPDNEEANNIVTKLYKTLERIVYEIKFSETKTVFDDQGIVKNKLNNLVMQKNIFWNRLELFLPKRWFTKAQSKDSYVNIELDKDNQLNLFFEYFEIKTNNDKRSKDKIVTNFLNEITKDVPVVNQTLVKAGKDSFLFSFYSIENNESEKLKNHIWYRICVKDLNILIVSFVLSYKIKIKITGEVYYNKINELIKSSELN